MCISRRSALIVLTLCLLVLQAQLFAASALGCTHAPDRAAGDDSSSACPYHQAGGGQTDHQKPESLPGCQKCVLHCAVGVCAPASAALDLPATPIRSALEVPHPRHFYSFSPDPFRKPPIS